MKISVIQSEIEWERQRPNYDRAERLIAQAAAQGAQMACLPELFSTGVTLESMRFAEGPDGPTCRFLMGQAREHGIYVVGSYIEENGRKLPHNTSITYGPDGQPAAKYHKSHLFTYGGEDRGYSLGKPRAVTFRVGEFTVCPLICYDLRFPEIFLEALDQGADLFIIQANWPNPRKSHWETLLSARAIECQAYVAGANQVGRSPRNTFFGASRILDPSGESLAEAGCEEGLATAKLDAETLAENRRRYPFLKERRM